ncbi:hypothetical protein O6U66_00125 [Sphingomonas faeni]
MATLPVSMPDEAAIERECCVLTLEFKGTMLSGLIGTRYLVDPALALVLDRTAALSARATASPPHFVTLAP